MATVTHLGTATFSTASGTKTVTATPAVGDLIVIVTAHSGNTSAAPPTDNNTDGGGRYVEVTACASLSQSSANQMRVWVRTQRIQSASSTVFTHAPGASTGGGLDVFNISGMVRSGLNAIRQGAQQSNQAASGTPTPVLGSTSLTTNPLIGAVFNATSPATMTPRASWTEATDLGYSTPTTGLETMFRSSGETSTSIAWGGTSGSAFGSTVVELDASTPSVVNDPSESDYWAGQEKCEVGMATKNVLAVVALSSALCFGLQQQQEEAFPPTPLPAQASSSPPPTQRAVQRTTFIKWDQQDDLPIPAASPALDDGDAVRPPDKIDLVNGIIWATDEEIVPQPSGLNVDDDGRIELPPAVPARAPIAFAADEEIVPQQAALHVDDDGTIDFRPIIAMRIPTAFWSDEEIVPKVEDDYWQIPAPRSQRAVFQDPWSDSDFAAQAASPSWLDDDPWAPPAPRQSAVGQFQLWANDELRSATPSPLVEEEAWQQPKPASLEIRALQQIDDEALPHAAPTIIEEQDGPRLWPVIAAARVFVPQDSGDGPVAPPVGESEWSYWQTFPTLLASRTRLFVANEEILLANALSSDPRYIVRIVARGFSDMEVARAFTAAAGARTFTDKAQARSFSTSEGARSFTVYWKDRP